MEILGALAIVLLVLACPLAMLGMGVGAWIWARARGRKKELSLGCMPGHAEQPQTGSKARTDEMGMREEVVRLQQEVQALKAQAPVSDDI